MSHRHRSDIYRLAQASGVSIAGSALSIGCAAGEDARHLRDLGASTIWGIEPVAAVADLARSRYDHVYAWEYTDAGIMDRTHLRFFTSKSIRRFMRDNGFDVVGFGRSGTWRPLPAP